MALPRIIFYAYPGFEADIVESGLSNLGFTIASVSDVQDLLIALKLDPDAIVLIDAGGRDKEIGRLLPNIHARQKNSTPIFVMESRERITTKLPDVRVIPASRRIRGAVFGIAEYAGVSRRSGPEA